MKLKNVSKSYNKNNEKLEILKDINCEFQKGKLYVIEGRSGSGKSTLINILGLIDVCDGSYTIDGIETKSLSDSELTKLRKDKIGMVFQNHYLNPRLTAKENVKIATFLNDLTEEENEKHINEYFHKLNLEDRMNHYPKELSGGEQARVAIIRALINHSSYILADEPSGNLDKENAIKIYEILKNLTKDDKCVIVVSHDSLAENYADVIYELDKGTLTKKN